MTDRLGLEIRDWGLFAIYCVFNACRFKWSLYHVYSFNVCITNTELTVLSYKRVDVEANRARSK